VEPPITATALSGSSSRFSFPFFFMALVMGSSQSIKATCIEDTLSLVTSCCFLVGFVAGAVPLLGFGLYVLRDSAAKLVAAEHTFVQTEHFFLRPISLGWLMVAALAYSALPPLPGVRLAPSRAENCNQRRSRSRLSLSLEQRWYSRLLLLEVRAGVSTNRSLLEVWP
jgi:hypothetical protein